MVWAVFIGVLLAIVIAPLVNVIAFYVGKLRFDVLTFFYLPIWLLFSLIPLTLALLGSIIELVMNPRLRWRDTIGGKLAIGLIVFFFTAWTASAIVGSVLRWFGWKDGPTPPVKIIQDPNKKP